MTLASHVIFGALVLFCFCIFFFVFLGLTLRHMDVPRSGVESELQLPAYNTAIATLHLQPAPQLTAMPDPLTH